MNSFASHLYCSNCSLTADMDVPQHLCSCGSPYLVRYDLNNITITPHDLRFRPPSLWRYAELLPINDTSNIITLGEGFTPLLPITTWSKQHGLANVLLKDEGCNPTGTFKARGAAVGISKAKQLGITDIAMPTAGNAGSAWSLYAARANITAHVAMPQDAPAGAIKECIAAGADIYLIHGLISDAGKLITTMIAEHGWYNAATLCEPYRIEGKKTMGLELAEQLNWKLPDVILYPCGGGVGLIGLWKAFNELEELGWIDSHRPRLVAVQATGCSPIVQAFNQGQARSQFFHNAATIAGGLRVPKALGDFLVLRAIRETGGTAVSVSDQELLSAMTSLAREEGLLICPEGAATLAALIKLRDSGWLTASEQIVILNTGSGLKYTDLIETNTSAH